MKAITSDIARTVYFLKDGETKAPEKIQQTFDAIHEAITLAGETMKPGMKGHEVDHVARQHLVQKGYPEIEHATGHQVGREVHDGGGILDPTWERYGDAHMYPLKRGIYSPLSRRYFYETKVFTLSLKKMSSSLKQELTIYRKDRMSSF